MGEKNSTSFKFAWGVLMVIAYMGIAYLVVFTPVLIRYNETNDPRYDNNFIARVVLGIILFLYGVFRGYRIWKINQ